MATYHCSVKHGSKGNGASSAAKADYICREGKYEYKPDLEHKESGNMPEWAQESPRVFWHVGDQCERANGRVYTEIEVALPREITPEQRRELVQNFIREQLHGHPYTVAIHIPKATLDGGDQPHAHIIFSERKLDGIERNAEQFFKRANAKEPEKGGTAKDRTWNEREKVQQIRESWEQHYNRHSPEQVSCRSLKEQGIAREPERHLGPKMARPDAPEAGKVMETRGDLKKLEEIEREMVKLSREIATQDIVVGEKPQKTRPALTAERKNTKKQDISHAPEPTRPTDLDELASSSRNTTSSEREKAKETARLDQAKQPQQVATLSDLLNEGRTYSKTLEELDTARSEALYELRKQKEDLFLPYRAEAIERHVTQELKPRQEKLNTKIVDFNSRLEAHEKAGFFSKCGWDVGYSYNKAADKLTKEGEELRDKQEQLKNDKAREMEKFRLYAYKADKLADKLAQERDPDYQNKKAAIEQTEEKIVAARQISQPEIKRVRELCRHLAKVDGQQQIKLIMPLDRMLKNPDIVNRLNEGFEKHDKTKKIERDHGMVR
jgi:hypothetical protein